MPSSIHVRLLCLLLLGFTSSYGQNVPDLWQTAPAGAADTITLPPAFSKYDTLNYIRSYSPRIPLTNSAQLSKTSLPVVTAAATVYRDGFNQDMETVLHNSHASGTGSLVTPADGRVRRGSESFLPYYSNAGNYGFRSNAFREQKNYYDNLYPGEGGVSYSMSRYSSDANVRSIRSLAPGRTQAGQGNGLTVRKISNDAYTGVDYPTCVRMWALNGSDQPVSSGWYPADQLRGELSEQSYGGVLYTFSDKEGRLVYKAQYLEDKAVGESGVVPVYAITYYVYDGQGRLRYILPPKATAYSSSGSVDNNVLDNLCFQYRYDERGRLSAQRDPGEEGFTEIVYDPLDRAVLRRSPLEKQREQWEVTYYDRQGRITATSLLGSKSSRSTWQGIMDAGTPDSDPANPGYYLLHYNDTWQPPGETDIPDNAMMSYHFYDDYSASDYSGSRYGDMVSVLAFGLGEYQTSEGHEMPERSRRTHGLPTSSRLRILPSPSADTAFTGDWRETILYYDDKGRVINTLTEDYYQGNVIHYDYTGNQYNFSNQLLVTKHRMGNLHVVYGDQEHTELLRNEYETNTGRLQRTVHKVDNEPWKVLAAYAYDDLGQLSRKTLGNGGEVRDMSYNIRGQLTGINGLYARTGDKQGRSRSFGESLSYDYGFSTPRYDGKIAGMIWRGAGNASVKSHAYGYSYDKACRLTRADYRRMESQSPVVWSREFMDYSVWDISYDVNGNLKTMNQNGVKPGTGIVTMDRLHYTYEETDRSNRLLRVTDSASYYDLGDFNNTNGISDDYGYDVNGNLSADANKGLAAEYTFFNKPSVINGDEGKNIEYSYDASGMKVQELILDEYGIRRRDFVGNAVYQGDTMQYINTAEGRTLIDKDAAVKASEEFYVKDHLGNVRSRINVLSYSPSEYLATYEVASAGLEGLLFGQMDEIRIDKPGAVDTGDAKAGVLNGADSTRRTGTTLLVKVMAGDKISMNVNSYYESYDAEHDAPVSAGDMLRSVLGTMTAGIGGYTGSEGHDVNLAEDMFSHTNFNFFQDLVSVSSDAGKPKAYLNYLFFNEKLDLVSTMSGAFQADGYGSWSQIGTAEAMEIPENGYMAVYLSNSTTISGCYACGNVYFDQLSVQITKGNLLEENHYYPFGLPMQTLSSVAAGAKENKRKYQGNEYNREHGLNWMDFNARQYDPQLGRFLGVDPKAASGGQEMVSPYAAMGNAPEGLVDPNGEEPMKMAGSGYQFQTPYLNFAPGSFAWLDMGGIDQAMAAARYEAFLEAQDAQQREQDAKSAKATTGTNSTSNGTTPSTTQGDGKSAGNEMRAESGNDPQNTTDKPKNESHLLSGDLDKVFPRIQNKEQCTYFAIAWIEHYLKSTKGENGTPRQPWQFKDLQAKVTLENESSLLDKAGITYRSTRSIGQMVRALDNGHPILATENGAPAHAVVIVEIILDNTNIGNTDVRVYNPLTGLIEPRANFFSNGDPGRYPGSDSYIILSP